MSKTIHFSFRILLMFFLMSLTVVYAANFSELFLPIWAPDHFIIQENQTSLYLDNSSGCGFMSKSKYLFGKASAEIKLVPGDSAGTITAFYLSSEEPYHDELDFEFLGNVSGQPYLVQTNVFVNGTGDREQRHSLWFDPTTSFHNYSFFWNHQYIIFQVDETPIRMFANKESIGVPFPKNRGMRIHGSLWSAESWATQGGRVKTNWNEAPFVATFGSFDINSCEMVDDTEEQVSRCGKERRFWWDKSSYKKFNKKEEAKLKLVQDHYLVYDYCKDAARFSVMPIECLN